MTLQGIKPAMTGAPVTFVRGPLTGSSSLRLARTRLAIAVGDVLRTRLAEVPGQQPEQLLEVADERRVTVHLHAEVLEDGDARRAGEPPCRGADELLGDAADGTPLRDRHGGQRRGDLVEPGGPLGQPCPVGESLVEDDRCHRPDEPGVAPWAHPQVEVGELGRLRAARVDHDHRPRGVVGDGLQRRAGVRDAVAQPRVLADEQRHLAVLEVATDGRTEHPPVHPRLTRLLLGDGTGAEAGAERVERGGGVRAAEVVALPATAVVHDRLAAVLVADRAEPRRDLADRGVPVDLLERAVRPPSQRVQDALAAAVLVVVEAQRLLARVALGRRDGPCRRAPARSGGRRRRGAPRRRSCTRRGCTRSASTRWARRPAALDRVRHQSTPRCKLRTSTEQ